MRGGVRSWGLMAAACVQLAAPAAGPRRTPRSAPLFAFLLLGAGPAASPDLLAFSLYMANFCDGATVAKISGRKSEIQSNLEHQILRANVSQRSLTENEVLSRSSQCDSPAESTGRLEKRSLVVFFFSPFFDGNRSLSVSSLPGQCKRNVSRGEQNTSPFANSRGHPYPCARSLVRRSF